jgi:hypothetical protein
MRDAGVMPKMVKYRHVRPLLRWLLLAAGVFLTFLFVQNWLLYSQVV